MSQTKPPYSSQPLTGNAAGTIGGLIIGWTHEDPPRLYAMGDAFVGPEELLSVLAPHSAAFRGEVNEEEAWVCRYTEGDDKSMQHIIDTLTHLREQHPSLVQLTFIEKEPSP